MAVHKAAKVFFKKYSNAYLKHLADITDKESFNDFHRHLQFLTRELTILSTIYRKKCSHYICCKPAFKKIIN